MKISTCNAWIELLSYPLRALFFWWIWNSWIRVTLSLPAIDYLTAVMAIFWLNCFSFTPTYLIGKIADHLGVKQE